MYSAYNSSLHVNICHLLTVCEPKPYTMRQKNHFVTKCARTNLRAMFVSIIGTKLWNALHSSLISIKTSWGFTNKFREYTLRMYVSRVEILICMKICFVLMWFCFSVSYRLEIVVKSSYICCLHSYSCINIIFLSVM